MSIIYSGKKWEFVGEFEFEFYAIFRRELN